MESLLETKRLDTATKDRRVISFNMKFPFFNTAPAEGNPDEKIGTFGVGG